MEEDGGENIYNFILNNPIDYVDLLGQFKIEIEIQRKNDGKHATLGEISVQAKGFATLSGVTLEPIKGEYDLGNGKKSYPIPPGQYSAKLHWRKLGGKFTLQIQGTEPFFKEGSLLIHKGSYPWDTEGCILPGQRWIINFPFQKTVKKAFLDTYVNAGMATITKKTMQAIRKPAKIGNKTKYYNVGYKYLIEGETDIVSGSGAWLDSLEELYEKAKKKYGKNCVEFSVRIKGEGYLPQ